jgi:hypothetical protein
VPTAAHAAAAAACWADVAAACGAKVPLVAVQLEGSLWRGRRRISSGAAYVPTDVPSHADDADDDDGGGGGAVVAVRPLLEALLAHGPPLGHSTEYLEPFLDRLAGRCAALSGGSALLLPPPRHTSKGIKKMLAAPEGKAQLRRKASARNLAK